MKTPHLFALCLLSLVPTLASAADAGTVTAASPDAGTRSGPKELSVLAPPLGRIGDVVQPVPAGGRPGSETIVTATFPGCDEPRALYLSRFMLMGAARAGEQVQQWLTKEPAIRKKLFGKKDRLAEALAKARQSTHHEGAGCQKVQGTFRHVELPQDGRLEWAEAPALLCKLERGPVEKGGIWLFTTPTQKNVKRKDFGAAVALAPAAEGQDACLPRMSAVLFDDAGKARLRYHANFGGALQVVLVGDKCRAVVFNFDEGRQVFVPEVQRDPACPKKASRSGGPARKSPR